MSRVSSPIKLFAERSDTGAAIEAFHLHRVFQKRGRPFARRERIVAVDDISFQVPQGTIFGMLGPNGAGKTTTIKMLSTLLIPSDGLAVVGGYDVVREDRDVRRQLGVVLGGDRGLYAKLTARDNLTYFGHLYGMRRDAIRRRVEEMLDLVHLQDRGDERVEGFSRGMKQRLHLAKALLHDPPILFLDEPTIGLDPAAAIDLREAIAALVPEHTVLLTTHDMYEADLLCDEIAIVNQGRIVAQGTPADLKSRVAGECRVVVSTRTPLDGQVVLLQEELVRVPGMQGLVPEPNMAGGTDLTVRCTDTAAALDAALAALHRRNTAVSGVRVIEPTLEDVFLTVAGRALE